MDVAYGQPERAVQGNNAVHGGPCPPPLLPLLAHGALGAPLLQRLLPISPASRAEAPLPAASGRHHATAALGQQHKALRVRKGTRVSTVKR
jgi:hypothetical protein